MSTCTRFCIVTYSILVHKNGLFGMGYSAPYVDQIIDRDGAMQSDSTIIGQFCWKLALVNRATAKSQVEPVHVVWLTAQS